MPIYATAGATIDIGQPLAAKSTDFVTSDFDAQSWINIAWWENGGEFGDESSEVTFDAIGEGRTQKLKGVRNAGTQALVFGIDTTDDGQATVRGAETLPDDFAFRVTFNDLPAGGSSKSERFFIAKVMSAREQLNEANSVLRLLVSLGINSNVVHVDAV